MQFDWGLIKLRTDVPKLLNFMKVEGICEVGVRDGDYFKLLLIKTVNYAVAIDVWDAFEKPSQNDIGDPLEKLSDSCKKFKAKYEKDGRVVILKMQSSAAHNYIPDKSLDFIYIDADHTYEGVRSDLENYWPKLKPGGILAGHDYIEYSFRGIKFGVMEAVNEFVKKNNLFLHLTEERFKSFFYSMIDNHGLNIVVL